MDSFHKLSRVRNSEPTAASTGTIMDSRHKISGVSNSEPISVKVLERTVPLTYQGSEILNPFSV